MYRGDPGLGEYQSEAKNIQKLSNFEIQKSSITTYSSVEIGNKTIFLACVQSLVSKHFSGV
jgi:hypothetical protein